MSKSLLLPSSFVSLCVFFQVRDGSNSLADAHLFIDHLVVNKLYLDLFLQN